MDSNLLIVDRTIPPTHTQSSNEPGEGLVMKLIKWWHQTILKHRTLGWQTLTQNRVVFCECGAEWTEPTT